MYNMEYILYMIFDVHMYITYVIVYIKYYIFYILDKYFIYVTNTLFNINMNIIIF